MDMEMAIFDHYNTKNENLTMITYTMNFEVDSHPFPAHVSN